MSKGNENKTVEIIGMATKLEQAFETIDMATQIEMPTEIIESGIIHTAVYISKTGSSKNGARLRQMLLLLLTNP